MSTLFSHFFEKINRISPQEHEFTEVLSDIALVPKMLYYYGKLPEIGSPSAVSAGHREAAGAVGGVEAAGQAGAVGKRRVPTVAIVGTRKNTKYGEEVAFKAAEEVAKRGGVVVSGMAMGIDGVAHRGALAAGGKTVAVLGTAIDDIYPQRHYRLAEEIIRTGGAVMSEYAPGVKTYRGSFLERNRLIAGLADVVLIVEANERSGSLNTAMHAVEQGREVFAVPGDIMRPLSMGCNRLIAQGAQVYTGVEDILRVLFPGEFVKKRKGRKAAPIGETPEETAILALLFTGVTDGDEIVDKTGIEVAKFNQVMTLMEIRGQVRALGANQWSLS